MHDVPRRARRARIGRRLVPIAAVLFVAAAACASAGAQVPAGPGPDAPPSVAVVGDSVVVSGEPFGSATIQVARPDALTHKPIVLGQFAGSANPLVPFTVNTTTPTAFDPDGDCWQRGALSEALTPDIRPGDTVTVTSAGGIFGGAPRSTSVVVPANGTGGSSGPIPACRSLAPLARNAVTGAPTRVSGGPIDVSGVAQPLATSVSASVTDGTRSTAPVTVSPNADGTWSASIPAAQADALADGSLTVQPVFGVPDVSTGAAAHITAGLVSIDKSSAHPNAQSRTKAAAPVRVRSLRVRARISAAAAARGGLHASFVVPSHARFVSVRLTRHRHTVFHRVLRAAKAGHRQTVRVPRADLRRRGTYVLSVSAGSTRTRLGTPVRKTIRVI
jgi:hypothetical protein